MVFEILISNYILLIALQYTYYQYLSLILIILICNADMKHKLEVSVLNAELLLAKGSLASNLLFSLKGRIALSLQSIYFGLFKSL